MIEFLVRMIEGHLGEMVYLRLASVPLGVEEVFGSVNETILGRRGSFWKLDDGYLGTCYTVVFSFIYVIIKLKI